MDNVSPEDNIFNTEAMLAAYYGQFDLLSALIVHGASQSIENDDKKSVSQILGSVHGLSMDEALSKGAAGEIATTLVHSSIAGNVEDHDFLSAMEANFVALETDDKQGMAAGKSDFRILSNVVYVDCDCDCT